MGEPAITMLLRKSPEMLYYIDHVMPNHVFYGRILDVGCGRRGWLSFLLKQCDSPCEVIALDIERDKVIEAKHIHNRLNGQADGYVTASLGWLPFQTEVFDMVVGNAVLHHVLDTLDLTLHDVKTVLKSNGKIVFSGEIVASRFLGWVWKMIKLRKLEGEGIATKHHWLNSFRKFGYANVTISLEDQAKYKAKLGRRLYYWLVGKLPDRLVVDYGLSSVTIAAQKQS